METLRQLFNDIPESVCDLVVRQLMLMHEQNVQLCTMKERLACSEDTLAKASFAPSGDPVLLQAPIPDLSLASVPSCISYVRNLSTPQPQSNAARPFCS